MSRRSEIAFQILIIACAIAFAVETLPGLSQPWRSALWFFEVFSVFVFSVEYV
jgi:hypothetical protein